MKQVATIASGWLLVCACGAALVVAAAGAAATAQDTKSKEEADQHKSGPAAKGDEHPAPAAAEPAPAGAAGTGSESPSGEHAAPGTGSGSGTAAAHDHGHADPLDLSHGDAGPALHQPQEWRFDLSIFTFVVFALLVAILAKFAWGPIAAGLEKREQTIAKQIADAEHASAMAAKQLQEYERKLAAATEEARAIVTQSRTDALSAKDKIVAEAQAAAAKERDRAVADITSAKNQALAEIAEKSVGTAITLASDIIRREVKPEDHDKLISESLQKFSSLN